MSETKTYTGGCHCGAVRFELSANIDRLGTCNCSICSKAGWMLTFVPKAQFKLLRGEPDLADYQFGQKRIHHYFCKTCGVRSFGSGPSKDGAEYCSVNVRCLDDFATDGLPVDQFDGKSL